MVKRENMLMKHKKYGDKNMRLKNTNNVVCLYQGNPDRRPVAAERRGPSSSGASMHSTSTGEGWRSGGEQVEPQELAAHQ
jgi:hypothetical protein